MHSFFKRISAALCAGMLTAACLPPLPATADKADYKPAPSISADFHPSGEDAVAISIPSKEHVDVLISRQNASGEDEILYRSNELQAYHNCLYYPLEPGEYDLSVSMEAIKYAPQKRTYTEHISIPEPDGFSHTEFRYQLSVKKAENTDEGIPEIVSQDEGILDQIKYTEADLAFKRYDMIQGDYDGNGEITVNDAQLTLNAFLTNMTADPDGEIPNPGQLAACDIDGNGELMASDAQWILLYYLELLLETDPKWPYSTYTDEKTMLIAVGAYHEDEHAVGISWIGTQWMDKVDVLISPDGNAYTVAATVQDDTKYSYPVDDDFASAYFKVSYTDEDGETIESAPFFVDAKNDGITVEYPDTDGDGLSDILEEMLQTDPAKKDTDADGLDDAQELKLTNTDPTKSDSFKAGIPDSDADCDDDGLTNLEEVTRGTNPLQADTDADGLSDRAEIFEHKTDPLLADTDGDGLEDGFEIRYGLDPLHSSTDGTPDADRQITQTFESQSDALKSVNSDESPYALSVEITTNGDAEKEMAVSESSYSAFLESDAQIGDIIDLSLSDFLHTEKIHLSFAIKDECLDNTLNKYSEYDDMQGIKRLSIFKYYDEISMMLPVETQYDLENNVISADVTEAGTYCVIDLEVWFDLFNLEPEEIDAAIAAQNQPAESVTQSIQGGTNALQQVYTVPKAINPVQLYTDTNPYTHRNEYPVDLVFILQTSGPEMADVIYEYELDVLEEVVGYVFRNYSNVRVHVVHYDADKAEAVRFGSLTYCTNATAFSRGIRALSYTTDDNYCPTKPAFQTATHDLQLRNSVNTYFYHMHNGNNLYTLDYDGIVMSESNYGIFSQVLPEGYYFNDDSYPSMLHDAILANNGIDVTLSSDTVQTIISHIADNIDSTLNRTEYDALLSNSLKKITLKTALSSTIGSDSDYDGKSDWEEVDTKFITENANGTVNLPTLRRLVSALNLNISNLIQYPGVPSSARTAMAEALLDREVLPCISDPTNEDTDGDGLPDGKAVYYNGKSIAPKDPDATSYTGPNNLWKTQIKQMKNGTVARNYDPNGSGLDRGLSKDIADFLVDTLLEFRDTVWDNRDTIRSVVMRVKDIMEGNTEAGAYLLNFIQDEYKLAYHSQPDTWQREFGYNEMYDEIFKIGSYMNYGRVDFEVGSDVYSLWAWKGDYWNLQSGAEVGLYVLNQSFGNAYAEQYDVVNFEVPMTLSLYNYQSPGSFENLYNWAPNQNQWWVTGFDPDYPEPDPEVMVSVASVDLSDSHEDLFDALSGSSVSYHDDLKNYHVILDDSTNIVWIQWYNSCVR